MIDLIKRDYSNSKEKYRADVLESKNPEFRIMDDIRTIIDSVSREDVLENVHLYMFNPLTITTYENALTIYFVSTIRNQWFIYANFIIGIDNNNDSQFEAIIDLINARIDVLGVGGKMPQEVRDRLSPTQLHMIELTDESGSVHIVSGALPKDELHEWIDSKRGIKPDHSEIKKYITSPVMDAINDAINTPRASLENPDQVSIWDDRFSVNSWNESESGSANAREIAIKRTSKNRSPMTIKLAIEDFKLMLKGNEQASKFLRFYSESFREEIDIKEFADRLGIRPDNASRYIKAGRNILGKLKIEGSNGGYIYIFPSFLIGEEKFGDKKLGKRGKITIKSNELVDLTLGGTFHHPIPEWCYRLGKHSWFLADLVYSKFREDAKNVNAERCYHIITIPLTEVISALPVPNPNETNRIEQLIIEPIENAIGEFNRTETKHHGGMVLTLNRGSSVQDGSIVATLNKCEFFDLLVEIATKRAEHIERDHAEKIRKENRVLDARARQTARMEYQDKKAREGSET